MLDALTHRPTEADTARALRDRLALLGFRDWPFDPRAGAAAEIDEFRRRNPHAGAALAPLFTEYLDKLGPRPGPGPAPVVRYVPARISADEWRRVLAAHRGTPRAGAVTLSRHEVPSHGGTVLVDCATLAGPDGAEETFLHPGGDPSRHPFH